MSRSKFIIEMTKIENLSYIFQQSWAFGICGFSVQVKRLIPRQNDDNNNFLLGQAY